MSIIEAVHQHYTFPFQAREFQREAIEELAGYKKSAFWADPGTGKTYMASALALHFGLEDKIDSLLVLCPPLLVRQWTKWLESTGLKALSYKGTPTQRKDMDLGVDAVVMSLPIFKKDYERIMNHYTGRRVFVIVDECAAVRNTRTDNYRAVRDLSRLQGVYITMLSGTPVGNPYHAYAYINIKTPEVYRSENQFKIIHVTKYDQWKNPIGFDNLDLLASNLLLQSTRIKADEVLDLPEIQFVPVEYELEPAHKRLYDRLVEERLLEIEDGLIDAVTQQGLYNATQRLILKPYKEGITPAAFSIIEETAAELDIPNSGEKLIIFCNYQDSNEEIFAYISKIKGLTPLQCFGKMGPKRNQDNLQMFLEDPAYNVMIGNPTSVGVGVDSLQAVSRAVLFLELPITPNHFTQAISRVYRQGQKKHCLIKFTVAVGTVQQSIARNVVNKEDVIQKVMPTKQTLRGALYGK